LISLIKTLIRLQVAVGEVRDLIKKQLQENKKQKLTTKIYILAHNETTKLSTQYWNDSNGLSLQNNRA
jgi:hypothetical protein